MNHWRRVTGLLVLGLMLLTTGPVRADRVPSHKTVIPRDPGVRGDITVPYTTNGYTTLGVYQGVAPRIYATPIGSDLNQPQDRAFIETRVRALLAA